jgi:hypothetical protein
MNHPLFPQTGGSPFPIKQVKVLMTDSRGMQRPDEFVD